MASILSSAVLSGEVLENHQQLPQWQEILDTAEDHGEAFGSVGAGAAKGEIIAGSSGGVVLRREMCGEKKEMKVDGGQDM